LSWADRGGGRGAPGMCAGWNITAAGVPGAGPGLSSVRGSSFGFLPPLVGGGFWPAFAQIALVYYLAASVLSVAPAAVGALRGALGLRPPGSQPVVRWFRPPGAHAARDAARSLVPIAVKAAIFSLIEWLEHRGWGRLYSGPLDVSPAGLAYLALCIALLDYLHDAWFFWTHRLLHVPFLYRYVHFIHHESREPTPFSGYSFHAVEAALVFANEVLVCFLFPMHSGFHRAYHLFMSLVHCGGHAGYEIHPFIPTIEQAVWVLLRGNALAPGLNTVLHHELHHKQPQGHFSLYFTHWDRLCGTEHRGYSAQAQAVWEAREGVGKVPKGGNGEEEGERASSVREAGPPAALSRAGSTLLRVRSRRSCNG